MAQLPLESIYISTNDIIISTPRFPDFDKTRETKCKKIYIDIIRKLALSTFKVRIDKQRKQILKILQDAISGKIVVRDKELLLCNSYGEIEFSLLSDGLLKLCLLFILIQNGMLRNGVVLILDDLEANLDPYMIKTTVEIILNLQRIGVQIFISTHNYIVLKEFDLQSHIEDSIIYNSLYRDKENNIIKISSTSNYLDINPNAIDDAFGYIIDREIKKTMRDVCK